jgi:hypothetical protein
MSRKQDPIHGVVRYFREAELPLAQQALSVVQAIVRERGPKSRNNTPAKKPTTRAPATAAPVGTVGSSAD